MWCDELKVFVFNGWMFVSLMNHQSWYFDTKDIMNIWWEKEVLIHSSLFCLPSRYFLNLNPLYNLNLSQPKIYLVIRVNFLSVKFYRPSHLKSTVHISNWDRLKEIWIESTFIFFLLVTLSTFIFYFCFIFLLIFSIFHLSIYFISFLFFWKAKELADIIF